MSALAYSSRGTLRDAIWQVMDKNETVDREKLSHITIHQSQHPEAGEVTHMHSSCVFFLCVSIETAMKYDLRRHIPSI